MSIEVTVLHLSIWKFHGIKVSCETRGSNYLRDLRRDALDGLGNLLRKRNPYKRPQRSSHS